MEDAHVHLLETELDKDVAFFAVFDGHGGECTNNPPHQIDLAQKRTNTKLIY